MEKLEEELSVLSDVLDGKKYDEIVERNKEIHPNRIWYLLKKFDNRGWIEWGTSMRFAWVNVNSEKEIKILLEEIIEFYKKQKVVFPALLYYDRLNERFKRFE